MSMPFVYQQLMELGFDELDLDSPGVLNELWTRADALDGFDYGGIEALHIVLNNMINRINRLQNRLTGPSVALNARLSTLQGIQQALKEKYPDAI